jgi:cytochrome c oxidase assembly factor 1
MVLAATALGISGWAVFMVIVANQEKISSSVVKQIMRSVREDAQLKEALGEAIRPQPEWWLNGDPKIHGRVSNLTSIGTCGMG